MRLVVGLPRYAYPSFAELKQAVIQHKKDIFNLVMADLAENKKFQSYGVPIDCLSLKSATLRVDYALEYTFDVKARLKSNEKPSLQAKVNDAQKRAAPPSDKKETPSMQH